MRKFLGIFPWSKYIAGFLIFTLLFLQTIRVEFFDSATAKEEDYRDIVSIFVDTDTYAALRPKILQYAEDIQSYLGETRASLYVVDAGVMPAQIAARNEKLYYHGDDETHVSNLVGTVLIGNLPIPMVSDGGEVFPSLYPYVDFADKVFVYNERSLRYELPPESTPKALEADIWHGVINPAVGREWQGNTDREKIEKFLDKTHLFYTKSGRFAPTGQPPRVFYYDGEYESESVNFRSLFQYTLGIQNAENLAYKRFTKYLLSDLNSTLLAFDAAQDTEGNDYLEELGIVGGGGDGLDAETIRDMQDIHTKIPIQSIIKDFQSIINKNTLSEALANIYNAGRYNSGTYIRADIAPLQMTVMDELARNTLKEANNAVMKKIDESIQSSGFARKIAIGDSIVSVGSGVTYDSYFFGRKASTITEAAQCSIARGSSGNDLQYGRGVLVEANAGYDINTTEGHAEKLKIDTEELVNLHKSNKYLCFDSNAGTPKIQSYWGNNTLLRVVGSDTPEDIMKAPPDSSMAIKGFSEPIFSLGGMIETTRLSTPSLVDCMGTKYQYSLKSPYKYQYTVSVPGEVDTAYSCEAGYPGEWNRSVGYCYDSIESRTPRYTCITQHDVKDTPEFQTALSTFSSRTCFVGSMKLNGTTVASANNPCFETIGSGEETFTIDTTVREDYNYRLIPGFLKHISPTDEEISAAEQNGVTPSLPVDMVRYLEFLTPKGNIARMNYPNFFEAPLTDRASIRAWLKNISDTQWNAIISRENGSAVSSFPASVESLFATASLPSSPIDWNSYISDESIDMVLRARNWLNPDVTKKYKQAIETSLSYSREYPSKSASLQTPKYPLRAEGYDIAYLGLFPFEPSSEENVDEEISQIQSDYDLGLSSIHALNVSEPYQSQDQNPYGSSDKCGPPEGVNIFQWPAAIMCWIKTLLPPRIIAGSCSVNTIGISNNSGPLITPSASTYETIEGQKAFYEGGKLYYHVDRTSLQFNDSIEAKFEYVKDNQRLNLPYRSSISLEVLSLVDESGREIGNELASNYIRVSPQKIEVTDAGGKALISSRERKAVANVRAVLDIVLSDGSLIQAASDPIRVRVTTEYLKVFPKNKGSVTPSIDVTDTANAVSFDLSVVSETGSSIAPSYPVKYTLIDDVSGNTIGSGGVITTPGATIDMSLLKTVGVYRFIVEDANGRVGESTLSVESGDLSKIVAEPISSMIRTGANTLMVVRLEDVLSNPVSPDLEKITIKVTGGYISDALGEKKTEMTIDTLDNTFSLLLGADTAGAVNYQIFTESGKQTSGKIDVIQNVKVVLAPETAPKVGGVPVKMVLKVQDQSGKELTNFDSVASLILPRELGTIEEEVVTIKNGVSSPFTFLPGTKAGVHKISLDIPGLGVLQDITFELLPGTPMYISHEQRDETLDFSVRDRYGNVVKNNFAGTLKFNTEATSSISFANGVYSIAKKGGFYTMHVPSLANEKISYTDGDGNHDIPGIPYYATYIQGEREQFDFLPDYNARYTVLYGESFLREGEDILFDSSSTDSQSLAVSTLLDTPYEKNEIVSIFPGGKIEQVNAQDDMLLETSVTIIDGYPAVNVFDSISMKNIARILYPVSSPILRVCPVECTSNVPKNRSSIEIIPDTSAGFEAVKENGGIVLRSGQTPFFRVESTGKVSNLYSIELVYASNDQNGALFDIITGGSIIGQMRITLDQTASIERRNGFDSIGNLNTPVIDIGSSIAHDKFSEQTMSSTILGYRFSLPVKNRTINESMVGPTGIDSIGETYENPGVGWQGANTSLLSYAAGDTVGEATKWFHSYTMINMGDPVAHVDNMAPGTHLEGIDRSIGTRLTSSLGSSLRSYSLRDMDKDGQEDIITLNSEGGVHLLLNRGTRIRYKEQIAYLPDVTERGLSIADMTGDGYGDIVSVDKNGTLIFIDNTERKFTRKKIIIDNGTEPLTISQFKIFDMDNDGKDDIVYLTESGELGILYGTLTAGTFSKNILETTLGITLSTIPEKAGGAIKFDGLPQIPNDQFGVNVATGAELDDSILQSEVYSQYSRITGYPDSEEINIQSDFSYLETQFDQTLSSAEASTANSIIETYIKSHYAPGYDIDVERSWRNISHVYLTSGDTVEAKIVIKNNGTTTRNNITYLDTIPSIFDSQETATYDIVLGNEKVTRDFNRISTGEYDAFFEGRDLLPGQSLTITYQVKALPMKHGNMIVSRLEKGESGDDLFGDVGFEASETCGDDMLIWRSGPSSRQYTKGTRSFAGLDIPEAIKKQIKEVNNLSTATSLSDAERTKLNDQYKTLSNNSTYSDRPLIQGNVGSNNTIELGFDSSAVENIEGMMQDFFDGLSCGFGGGSCMSFPINWAPLAPGSAPTIMGFPVFPLIPETGLPMFSGITGIPIYGPWGCFPVPSVFPASPIGFTNTCTANLPSAGGKLGAWDPTNAVRIYVTPTLTLGMGAALCFAGPASVVGRIPPTPLFGLIKGGNCIVVAKPMPFCKGDGSRYDGDVTGFSGLGSTTETWNANSCSVSLASKNEMRAEDRDIQSSVIGYLKNPNNDKRKALYEQINNRTARTTTLGPAIRIGGNGTSGTEVGIEIDSSQPFSIGNIVKVKNGRVPAFPDFIMKWVTAQVEEITNALFTAPSLVVVWPGVVGANMQFDGDWANFQKRFTDAYSTQSFENLKTQMGQAYASSNVTAGLQKSIGGSGKSSLANDFRKWSSQALDGGAGQTVNKVGGGIASVRAAYTFIGQLPFLNIRRETVNIDVPWILPGELDKYMKAYENYLKEYDRMMANWCVGKTAQECADAKIMFNSSGFVGSLKQNLKILNDYKNFPQKLQKYVTWKQRYMTELLCNVETVRQVLGGWIKDNGIRFKKWAELFVLLKALAESWQPLVDIFTDTSRKCGVCTNQRYDSLHWKFKLLSAVIPSPPIIRFPRWPDIVLDLSDIRLGINVSVPDFRFNVKPLRLPSLPNLTLPNSPNLALSLPALPILPALPNLPDLPSLPSLPKLALPNLPPPPKIPKLLGSIQAVLKIFKLLSTVYCFLNNTYLVPEGEVGDVIAKRTERQGKFSLDFLGIQFPNFTLPGIREIRVSTHVNFELRSDFITEFAKQAVKPINEFTTDLGRGIPKKIAPDINLSNPTNTINLTPRSQTEEMNEVLASLENISKYFEDEKDTLVDIDVFKSFLIAELEAAGLYDEKNKLVASLKKSERTSDAFIQKLTAKHDAKYDALEAYIQAEYDATGEMQNIIDALSGKDTAPLGFEGSDIRTFVSTDDDKAGKLLAAYDAMNVPEVMLPEENEMSVSEQKPKLAILARLDRLATSSLAAATTGLSTSSNSNDIPDGYLPAYKGVYVLTPSGVQTRLYDADITMAPEFDITTIDIDQDGDKDYIFVLDGALYVKYTGASKRSLYPDTEIEITTLRENALYPTTPDYFHETTNAPKSLSLNFTPADDREDEWRLEFYDRYLEWDKVNLGTHNASLVPHHVVDMVANDESSQSETSLFTFVPVNHILVSIASPTGFQMSGVKVTVLKTGDTFHLPVGKSIVTGDNDAQILILEGSGAGNTVNLIRAGSYHFKDVIKARVTSGKLFAFGSFSEEGNYTYSDDYVGMPIISSLQFIAPDGGMRVRYNPNNSVLTLNKGSQYSFLPLGTKESSYYVNMSYPDGVYSARMKSLDTEEVLTSISLFAPQIASDKSAPVIDFPETVRIPVYSTKSFALKDFISEMHDFTVRIDPNTTFDEDKNGIYDDDLTTTGSNIIVDANTLTFRAHTNLDTYTALMEVRDEMGNVSRKAFNVEIYAPIPSIDTITNTGWASGNVGESLINEPIHLFRVRPGTDIVPVTLNAVNTNLEGVFSSGTFFGASGAIFQNSGSTIRLNEYGVIDTSAVNATVSVTPAGTKNPMKFIIKDERGVSLYEQFMILPSDTNIAIESTSNATGGLLISSQGTYQFVQASYNDPNIPLGWYLVNSANQAIALLARDGNIYVTESKYSLRYSTKDGYILLSLHEGTNTLANFWYKVDFFYTIK